MKNKIKGYDRHHILYKDFCFAQSSEICRVLIDGFKKEIKEKLNFAAKIVNEWEKKYFSDHLVEPRIKDMDEETLKFFRCKTHAKSLIKSWNL